MLVVLSVQRVTPWWLVEITVAGIYFIQCTFWNKIYTNQSLCKFTDQFIKGANMYNLACL